MCYIFILNQEIILNVYRIEIEESISNVISIKMHRVREIFGSIKGVLNLYFKIKTMIFVLVEKK